MAYSVVILKEAQREYSEIVHYLSKVLGGAQAARAFVEEFERQVSVIRENPQIYAVSRMSELAAKGYRVAFVNKYVVLYTVRNGLVIIAHVFHQSQDYARLV